MSYSQHPYIQGEHRLRDEDHAVERPLWMTQEQAAILRDFIQVELQTLPLRAQACAAFGYPGGHALYAYADEFGLILQNLPTFKEEDEDDVAAHAHDDR